MAVKKRKPEGSAAEEKREKPEECDTRSGNGRARRQSIKPEEAVLLKKSTATVMAVLSLTYLWYIYTQKDATLYLARTGDNVREAFYPQSCSQEDYAGDLTHFNACAPKWCGRLVVDNLISPQDIDTLLRISKNTMDFAQSTNVVSIVSLHTGQILQGDQYSNLYAMQDIKQILSEEDFEAYRRVTRLLREHTSMAFRVPEEVLHIAYESFLYKIISDPTKKADNYWAIHADRKNFMVHYISLLYLGTYQKEFEGGRLMFVDQESNKTIEPKKGRLVQFTSGSENMHALEKISSGERYAFALSFTCNESLGHPEPSYSRFTVD